MSTSPIPTTDVRIPFAAIVLAMLPARLVQGVAAGGLMALAMASVADIVAPRERGRFQGYVAAVFGLGFGMVGQVLVVAVQNDVDRSRLGVAMATTTFFRGLGGAIGLLIALFLPDPRPLPDLHPTTQGASR